MIALLGCQIKEKQGMRELAIQDLFNIIFKLE